MLTIRGEEQRRDTWGRARAPCGNLRPSPRHGRGLGMGTGELEHPAGAQHPPPAASCRRAVSLCQPQGCGMGSVGCWLGGEQRRGKGLTPPTPNRELQALWLELEDRFKTAQPLPVHPAPLILVGDPVSPHGWEQAGWCSPLHLPWCLSLAAAGGAGPSCSHLAPCKVPCCLCQGCWGELHPSLAPSPPGQA